MNSPDVQFRFTVYKDQRYFANTTGPGPTDRIFDQETASQPTWSMWNTQVAQIMYRRTWSVLHNTQVSKMWNKKFFVPMRRKIVSENEGEDSNEMGPTKGGNYYWVLEAYAPGVANIALFLETNITTRAYFKDA